MRSLGTTFWLKPKEGRVVRKMKARPLCKPSWHEGQHCAPKTPPWRPCTCPCPCSSHPKLSAPYRIACTSSSCASCLQSCPSAKPTAWSIVPRLSCQTTKLSLLQPPLKSSFQGNVVQLWAHCQDLIIRSACRTSGLEITRLQHTGVSPKIKNYQLSATWQRLYCPQFAANYAWFFCPKLPVSDLLHLMFSGNMVFFVSSRLYLRRKETWIQ